MRPILCLFRHNYCSFKFENRDYIICQRCGKELKSPSDLDNFEPIMEEYK